MSLIDDVKRAQIRAGEQAVIDHLEKKLGGVVVEGIDALTPTQAYQKGREDGRAETYDAVDTALSIVNQPIDMILHCPLCGVQHVDAPESEPGPYRFEVQPGVYQEYYTLSGERTTWSNPPHRSHLCHSCGHIWRPADVPTNGVKEIKTKGKNDSPLVPPMKYVPPVPGHCGKCGGVIYKDALNINRCKCTPSHVPGTKPATPQALLPKTLRDIADAIDNGAHIKGDITIEHDLYTARIHGDLTVLVRV